MAVLRALGVLAPWTSWTPLALPGPLTPPGPLWIPLALPGSPPDLETKKFMQHPEVHFLGPPPSVQMTLYGLTWPLYGLLGLIRPLGALNALKGLISL